MREHSVFNVLGVIITTNHKTDGIFLPADDRRHYVAWSEAKRTDFADDYWNALWRWYAHGGYGHVAAYLAKLDTSSFDPKTPPPKTPAFWSMVDANRAPEDAELADVLDALGNPDAVTLEMLINATTNAETLEWLQDRKNRRALPHRLERCGFVPIRNNTATDGLWKLNKKRQAIYAKDALSLRDRFAAARGLADSH